MHAIIEASRRARQHGGRLVLVRGDPRVYRLFMLTGSVDDVEIADLERPTPFAQSPAVPRHALSGRGCVR